MADRMTPERPCPSCGRPYAEGQAFCAGCGLALTSVPPGAPVAEPPGPRGWPTWVLATAIVAVVAVAATAGFVVLAGNGGGSSGGAACRPDERRTDYGAPHVGPGEIYEPPERPASSGPHDASVLPPGVYGRPVPEVVAVHNLEHGYVIVYYRSEGSEALSPGTVADLEALVRSEPEVIMAPYPDLPEGTALALVAWQWLQTCSAEVTASEAVARARRFIAEHRNGPDAPEAAAR
jgi:hypothetical protein